MNALRAAFAAPLLLALLAACGGAEPQPDTSATPPPAETAAAPAPAPAPAPAADPAPAPAAAPAAAPAPAAPPAPPVKVPDAIAQIVAAPDRSPEDRALDAGRHPAEMLAFFGIGPKMKVAELGAGGGYTAELLARAVGKEGKVWGQNSKWLLEKFAEKPWSERLKKPALKNVARADREFDDPLPADAKNLDAVLMIMFYHDTVWLKTDRDKMNKAIFAALKSGGVYGIVDHSARAGAGTSEAESLHRIEEKVVREEVERAGFKFAGEGGFLRNAEDKRDWSTSPGKAGEKRGTSDRFVLKFVKP